MKKYAEFPKICPTLKAAARLGDSVLTKAADYCIIMWNNNNRSYNMSKSFFGGNRGLRLASSLAGRAAAAFVGGVIGIFLAVKCKAFLFQAWYAELPMWTLMLFIGLLAAACFLLAPTAVRLHSFVGLPLYADALIGAVCIGAVFLWREYLTARALEGYDVTMSGATELLYLIGGGLLLTLFILITLPALRRILADMKPFLRAVTRGDLCFFAAAAAIVNLLVLIYAKNSSTIYYWDNAGYWTVSRELSGLWRTEGTLRLLGVVFDSVLTLDYNYLIILPAIVFARLFGPSRYVFLAAIANFGYLPVCVLIWYLAKRSAKHSLIAAAAVLLFTPMLFYAVLLGFVDVGGIIFVLAAMIITLGTERDGRADRMLIAGVLLAAAVLMRRWYAFCALAFVISLIPGCVRKRSAYPLIAAVSGFAFTLLFFFQTLVSTKLLADYRSLYVAYKLGLDKDFLLLFRYFGIIPLLVFLAAGIYLLLRPKQRINSIFLLLWSALCFALFIRVQTHGQQHLLMYSPAFMGMLMLTYGELEASLRESKRVPAGLTAIAMSLTVSLSPFLPRKQPGSLSELKKPAVLPSFSWSPPTRPDAMTVVELLRRLDEFGAEGKRVGLLASSFILNQDMLLNSEASLSLPRVSDVSRSYLVYLPDVDQRDGWSDALFGCDIIAVADPPQTHLGEENQAVVVLPARELLSGEGIGKGFRRLDESFCLSGGVTVYIFEKTRELTDEERESLREKFRASHPRCT